MKKSIKVSLLTFVLLLIYVIGLCGGIYTLEYMASGWKRDDLESYAGQRILEYMSTGTVDNWSNGGMATIIYDSDGKFKGFSRMNGDPFTIDFVLQSEDSIPSVLSGQTTMNLYPFVKDYSKLGYTSYLYIGLPMIIEGKIDGAFFWVKELPDLSESLIAYAIVFTVFFAVVLGIMFSYLRLQRRYETMRNKYVDNITHEMKTPIASIRALAEALTDGMGKTESERNTYYGMIIGEANRQERMILDALTLAKLQSNSMRPQRQHIHAANIFEPLCEKHAALCELVGVNFHVSNTIHDLPVLYSDAQSIHQVLEILLGNARKFTEEGGNISLTATIQRGRVVVCITDDGVGIPKEDLPYVFERFYKGSQRCNETGSGLGLAIAKETLAAIKEKIWIQSGEEWGTSIYFTILLA